MGHDKPLTMLNSYGQVSVERQAEIIGTLGRRQPQLTPDEHRAARIAEMHRHGIEPAIPRHLAEIDEPRDPATCPERAQ